MYEYEEPKKLTDNDALNELNENVKELNQKMSFFYWISIVGLALLILNFLITIIAPYVSYA